MPSMCPHLTPASCSHYTKQLSLGKISAIEGNIRFFALLFSFSFQRKEGDLLPRQPQVEVATLIKGLCLLLTQVLRDLSYMLGMSSTVH